MKKTFGIFFNLFLIIVSLGAIFISIGYEKQSVDSYNNLLLTSIEENIELKSGMLNNIEITIIFLSVVIFILSIMFLLKIVFKIHITSFWHILIYLIASILISIAIVYVIVYLVNKYMLSVNKEKVYNNYNTNIIVPNGCNEIVSDTNYSFKKYSCNDNDKNTILLKNGSNSYLSNLTIYKYGNSTNLLSSKIYGTNSAILVLKDTKVNISNTTIDTFDTGSNAIFSALDNSHISANMVNIQTASGNACGMVASLNGYVSASNVRIKTSSSSSPAISSLRGGKVDIENAIIGTNSVDSPIIRTSSTVNLINSTADANNSSVLNLEGVGNVKIVNSDIRVSANKFNKESYDSAFYIYRNFKLKRNDEYAYLDVIDSNVEIKKQSKVYNKAPIFTIYNNNAVINISNDDFKYGSDIFLNIINNNNNSIFVKLNSNNQQIDGDINIDNKSVLELSFNDTVFNGSINNENNAVKITLNIDKNSTLELTNDSYISVINNSDKDYDNINSNGYNLYYNPEQNKTLNGEIINLKGGGKLIPSM